jgi:hypothetical protein
MANDGGVSRRFDLDLPQRPKEVNNMDLSTWLPAMFLLGLATFALMFAFVPACDEI